jgi:hypothetical protein
MVVDEKMKEIAPTFLATNMYFITNRLWFRLNKGFGNELPKSFSVIASAQIILSSLINNNISKSYTRLQQDVADGKIKNEEDIRTLYAGYRKDVKKPEDINENVVDDVISTILSDDNVEKHLREQDLLKQCLYEAESEKEIMNLEFNKNKEEIALLKKQIAEIQESKKRKEEQTIRSNRLQKCDRLRIKRHRNRIFLVLSIIILAFGINVVVYCKFGLSITLTILSIIASIVSSIGIPAIKKYLRKIIKRLTHLF